VKSGFTQSLSVFTLKLWGCFVISMASLMVSLSPDIGYDLCSVEEIKHSIDFSL
jgi:hypothetical protein